MARRSKMKHSQNAHHSDARDGGNSADEIVSKTALKRDADALKKLGVAISELPTSRRKQIEMPEDLREAIDAYARMTAHGAKKRQMLYIGKLLRGVDAAPLRQAVEDFAAGKAVNAQRLHEMERWRDRLISDDDAVTEWVGMHPDTDVQHLRSLIRAARRDRKDADASAAAPKSFKALFRYLSGA